MKILFELGLILTTTSSIGIIKRLKEKAENVNLADTQLLIGYEPGFIKHPIVVNMLHTPHLFVCGLSGSGKSRMVEYAIKDKEVVLINVFKDDFKNIKARRINTKEKILEYLKNLVENPYYRQIPLYLVIDELLVLCMGKEIPRAIMDLLAIGRHYNIFVIGISQIGTKETVKFKDLFNTRVCFRQVEESSYRAVLGYSPEIKDLRQRQFLLYSDTLGMGYTYDIRLIDT